MIHFILYLAFATCMFSAHMDCQSTENIVSTADVSSTQQNAHDRYKLNSDQVKDILGAMEKFDNGHGRYELTPDQMKEILETSESAGSQVTNTFPKNFQNGHGPYQLSPEQERDLLGTAETPQANTPPMGFLNAHGRYKLTPEMEKDILGQ